MCPGSANLWRWKVAAAAPESRHSLILLTNKRGTGTSAREHGRRTGKGRRVHPLGCDKEWLVSLSDESLVITQPAASVP
ncbi:hypothetical protein JZ751_022926 [Albula glossodonta]|uniref:Uncharacterized protein n=1 Tax=Albula glossodonta TaxID=121402 RepID=A0A8T2PGK2_9TELE|nr:hypothetical protein JZ751_022926 [Albula glossodonta]